MSINKFNLWMCSWYWNILESNLALMPSTKFDTIPFLWADQMEASFFFWLFPLIDAFYDNIGSIWFFYFKHLHRDSIFYDFTRKRLFTKFTLKLSKIIGSHNTRNFLFDFTIDPHFKTVNMNHFTWPLTFTRRNQVIIFCRLITKTELACSLNFFIGMKDSLEFFEKTLLFFLIFR